ncbi:hypothetical protein KUTeg_020456 [Tegillarca granosa]|uniref:Uncharacterized protein n=1 Tax=Tegillarca granosa TaxID=220873 RepID=A0ABQ9EAI3_TEGGR|nr:hypothetical protein KUTeg_020456 [Tegillarca granosa]
MPSGRFFIAHGFQVVQGYRTYDPIKLDGAYKAVKDEGMNRVDDRVHIDCCTTWEPPLFTLDHESAIYNHVKVMSEIGYGYTRSEVMNLASDYAFDRKEMTCT